MNELLCEMCGSNEIVKQNGLYVCQSCGTKYSVEEARKMMTGEKVEVEGTVKIDDSSEISNLYELASRAKNSNNFNDAFNYYDKILMKNPNNWEAQFYVLYSKARICTVNEIGLCGESISNSMGVVVNLIKNNVPENKQEDVIIEIWQKSSEIANFLLQSARNHYNSQDIKIRENYKTTYVNNAYPTARIMYNLGDSLMEVFDGEYSGYAVRCWMEGIELHNIYYRFLSKKQEENNIIRNYAEKINQYQPDYKVPKKGGCYIASSVYGSYNCPEVWTLRRFRDNTLENHILGKLFIKTYYATSPTLVKYFGDKKIFNVIFKPILDSFVKKLNEKGVKSTFYIDK